MPQDQGTRPKILVVDDIPANRLSLRRLLTSVDADLIEAGSGNEALALLLEHEVALVLLDVAMPDMDGYEVAELMRDLDQTRQIPIVFITAAYKDEAHRLQAYALGAVDYIEKPILDAILLAKVRVFLELWRNSAELRRAAGRVAAVNAALEAEVVQRRAAEQNLRLAASVFSEAHEGIIITDPAADILDVNRAFTELTGYPREEVLGKNPRLLQSGFHDRAFFLALWAELAARGHWRGEFWNRRKTGELYAAQSTIDAVRGPGGEISHYVGLFFDVTERTQRQERIEHLAFHDPLTQLPNRRLLADRMGQALSHADRQRRLIAVCYLDLDGFKPVNDRYGHKAGDQLLVEVARRLAGTVRAQDTVARLGGDEFVLLLTDLGSTRETREILARALDAIAAPVTLDNGESTEVSASIGVTHYPEDASDPDTLLRHADQAMYQAKQSGRRRVQMFDPRRERQISQRSRLRERLRQALKNGEYLLHWQPTIDIRQGAMVSAEALLRWRQTDNALVTPARFLPSLERDDLLGEIDEWVIGEALRQWAAWHAGGLRFGISVNITARLLRDEAFPERLLALFRNYPELKPAQLELEIIETAELEDLDRVVRIMEACRRAGLGFALDDFGTGYGSLLYFRRLPARTVKIDQSFVRGMLADRNDLAIVEGILGLARAFGRTAVAEGVETAGHGAKLLALGCHLAQGYGLAPPMPAEALPGWLLEWRMPDLDENRSPAARRTG